MDMSLDKFIREAAALAEHAGKKVQAEGVKLVHAEVQREAKVRTPVGGILTKDRHPGLMKKSWRTIPGDPEQGKPIEEVNEAEHAQIIDLGRKRSKRVKGREKRSRAKNAKPVKGKMLGSKQAPRGISQPIARSIKKKAPALLAKAVQIVEGQFK